MEYTSPPCASITWHMRNSMSAPGVSPRGAENTQDMVPLERSFEIIRGPQKGWIHDFQKLQMRKQHTLFNSWGKYLTIIGDLIDGGG